ncbi:hypothetical protein L6452_30296 [Arctium lappa]|uniref:Uncharacterized protein n=1 Tax=Arctium lappa TaxID=4217 RepID=A0ACB8ZI19_ARCLA|nr:hypothetical protein L6452_30296 [Arctium lappa]
MNECQADATCKEIVLSQQPQTESFYVMDIDQTPISQYWYSQTVFRVCDETALKSLSNKKARVEIPEIPAPNFDLGYNPIKNVAPISVVKAMRMDKRKEICIEAEPPLKKCKRLGTTYNHEDIKEQEHLLKDQAERVLDWEII